MRHPPFVWILGFIVAWSPGCERSCLDGGPDCRVASPCEKLAFTCEKDSLEVRVLGDDVPMSKAPNAIAATGDVLLKNQQVTLVIAGVGHQNYLDPNGGTILDLHATGSDNDGLNQIVPIVGILPGDSVRFEALTVIDKRPDRVAVQARGTLFNHPEFKVYTLYELRPCEPGVRVRTEIVNGAPDPQFWALSDGWYWSTREPLPFTPSADGGFSHPSFDLLTINKAFERFPYLAAATVGKPPASYATVGCNVNLLDGFNSDTVSTSGLPRTIVPPRDYLVYERFIAVGKGGDVASAADVALGARSMLFGEAAPVRLFGKVVDGGGKPVTDASLLVVETGASRVPWTQARAPLGGFDVRVPRGRDYVVEVYRFGRKVTERALGRIDADRDVGELVAGSSAEVKLTVVDAMGKGLAAEIFFAPDGEAARAAVLGDFHGQYGACAPWLGPPPGGSPACNRALVAAGQPATVFAPVGRYHVYAYHGPFHTIARKTVDLTAGPHALDFTLASLPLRPTGSISADLHVHGAASFDSSIPDADRVLSFAAADVDVIVASDHEVVHDYGETIKQLGLEGLVFAIPGVETTGHIPWMKVPGDSFPRVIGHYNFWPLAYRPGTPRNGAPFDEFVEPGQLFDRVMPLFSGKGEGMIQLNHPTAPGLFGRDLGFPRAVHLNLLRDLPSTDDGTNAGLYVRAPAGGRRNDDHLAQEVMNGTQNEELLTYRAFWFYTLNQGRLAAGTANSDSHGLTDNDLGSPRNIVLDRPFVSGALDVEMFNRALREGRLFGTNGPIITATVEEAKGGRRAFGLTPFVAKPGGKLEIEVAAAPWVPIDEIRIITNGRLVKTIDGAAIAKPADPFGSAGLVRYSGSVPLAELLPPSGDAWIVVEAGTKLPLSADLGGGEETAEAPRGIPDGLPDTGDNNGDGKVDEADLAANDSVGPLVGPPPPRSDSDPLYHFMRVVTGGYPASFTNPFVLDVNGNGKFDAPGVTGGWR